MHGSLESVLKQVLTDIRILNGPPPLPPTPQAHLLQAQLTMPAQMASQMSQQFMARPQMVINQGPPAQKNPVGRPPMQTQTRPPMPVKRSPVVTPTKTSSPAMRGSPIRGARGGISPMASPRGRAAASTATRGTRGGTVVGTRGRGMPAMRGAVTPRGARGSMGMTSSRGRGVTPPTRGGTVIRGGMAQRGNMVQRGSMVQQRGRGRPSLAHGPAGGMASQNKAIASALTARNNALSIKSVRQPGPTVSLELYQYIAIKTIIKMANTFKNV